jgi:hypothetical protein
MNDVLIRSTRWDIRSPTRRHARAFNPTSVPPPRRRGGSAGGPPDDKQKLHPLLPSYFPDAARVKLRAHLALTVRGAFAGYPRGWPGSRKALRDT